jgi:hypothetical protein
MDTPHNFNDEALFLTRFDVVSTRPMEALIPNREACIETPRPHHYPVTTSELWSHDTSGYML